MTSPREHLPEEIAERAALYAAGALSADECAAVERALAERGSAVEGEVRALDPVVLAMAREAPPVEPDPKIREVLLRRIAREQPAPSTTRVETKTASETDSARAPRLPPGLFVRRADEGDWQPTSVSGVSRRILYLDRTLRRVTVLLRMEPGSAYPRHAHSGPEETLVLEGDLRIGDLVLRPGDYQRAEPGSEHGEQHTKEGCLVLVTAPLEEAV